MSTRKSAPTGTNGAWAPTRPTSWKRRGRSATGMARAASFLIPPRAGFPSPRRPAAICGTARDEQASPIAATASGLPMARSRAIPGGAKAKALEGHFDPLVPQLRHRLSGSKAGRPLHLRAQALRKGRRDAAAANRAPAQRSHQRHQPRQADAHRASGGQRPRARPRDGGAEPLAVLAADGGLRHRRRRAERLRSRRRAPHHRLRDQSLYPARHGRFHDVFHLAACCARSS